MSADGGDDGPGRREVARRVFAAEYDDADLSYSESEEERAPNYVVVPTGARVNRLFAVGVLTEVEAVNEDVLRARVVDPTGAFVVYAGQYQPEAVAALERADPPAFVAVTGKARTFQPEDAEQVYTSVRPESINRVDADTRDRWAVSTAEHTLARVAAFADALDRPERGDDLRRALEAEGVDPALAAGIPRAIDHYGTTRAYLAAVRDLALDAARVVAGDREEVEPLELSPGEGGDADVSVAVPDRTEALLADAAAATDADTATGTDATAGTDAAAETETDADTETGGAAGTGATVETDATAGTDATGEAVEDTDAPAGESPTAEAAGDAAGATAASGDDSADGSESAADAGASEADTEEMYELDEAEREEIESEFGTEFASGDDIPEAGAADIETPDPGDVDAAASAGAGGDAGGVDDAPDTTAEAGAEGGGAATDAAPEPTDDAESVGSANAGDSEAEPAGGETDGEPAGEPPSGDELEDAVVEEMAALGDGDAVGREELVGRVVSEYGVEASAVEDAIQDALMSGRCYESGDDELTPI